MLLPASSRIPSRAERLDLEPDTFPAISDRGGHKRIRRQDAQCLGELALPRALELLASYREGTKQSRQRYRCTSLSRVRPVRDIKLTLRASFDVDSRRPSRPSVSTAPIGAVSVVAVLIVTDSQRAHSAESASPRKPKVSTCASSSSEGSFDVWCFRAEVS